MFKTFRCYGTNANLLTARACFRPIESPPMPIWSLKTSIVVQSRVCGPHKAYGSDTDFPSRCPE